ncbi:MAG: beta-galactosidase [Candidatus Hydrogenedens sp.]|nr:beta-galactosidase [Candidatus Hydrogenedens sp.]
MHRIAVLVLFVLSGSIHAAHAQDIPRPEHPRPDMYRAEWANLNGTWEFGETNEDEAERFLGAEPYPDQIVVPFCRESKLSGLERREFVKNVWYRRSFSVPQDWTSPRVRLHIGACDWRTEVWVNGTRMGEHVGGNAPFWFDVTEVVDRAGENTVVVHAFDDTASGMQPLGKQSISGKSESIFYTPTTGIWQTVWLEGVGESYVRGVHIEPHVDSGVALLTVDIEGPAHGLILQADVHTPDQLAARSMARAQWRDNKMLISIPEPHLWTLEDPFLYNVKLDLKRGEEVVDSVGTYFGMRSVSIDGNAILLNGKPVFQRLVLDQGFYPEGVWTAPSLDALRRDIELSKAAGFNGARLHQKVFEPVFLNLADTMGYLVWGEYPSYGARYDNPAVDTNIVREWGEVMARDRNHPALIGWCPFNETPAAAGNLQRAVLELTRLIDPARPVIESSGWVHTAAHPEVLDAHDYDQEPHSFRERWTGGFSWSSPVALPERYGIGRPEVPFMVSEYGGIGWSLDESAWGYGNAPESIEAFYERFAGLTNALLDSRYHFGLCYTQLTDVEQEQNGLYQFDRTPKFDVEKLHAVLSRTAAYEENPPTAASLAETSKPGAWSVLVGSVHDAPNAAPWRYTTDEPADGWQGEGFDDGAWKTGAAPFGLIGGDYGRSIETKWRCDDLWLRQEFECSDAEFLSAVLVIFHDDDTDLYLNGKPLWSRDKWCVRYESFDVTEAVRAALTPGTNTLAAHVHQDAGGQFFDMALLLAK